MLLCLLQGGYMLLDGCRALVVGTYITPSAGDHAGQLGPWARLVDAVGMEPESTAMKLVFVVLGVLWLGLGLAVARRADSSWAGAIALAVGTLWYLVPGTVISVTVLVVMLIPGMRRALRRAS